MAPPSKKLPCSTCARLGFEGEEGSGGIVVNMYAIVRIPLSLPLSYRGEYFYC